MPILGQLLLKGNGITAPTEMDHDLTAGAGEQPILQRSRDFYPLAERQGSFGQEDVEME